MQCFVDLGCWYVWMGNDSHPELALAMLHLRVLQIKIAGAEKTTAQPQQILSIHVGDDTLTCNLQLDEIR